MTDDFEDTMKIRFDLQKDAHPLAAIVTIDGKNSSYRATLAPWEGWTFFDGDVEIGKSSQLGALSSIVSSLEAEKATAAFAAAAAAVAELASATNADATPSSATDATPSSAPNANASPSS